MTTFLTIVHLLFALAVIAGVLLVFVFLVVPAILGVMLTERMGLQLAIGWVAGTLVSIVGLAASYYGDLPSGPTVVDQFSRSLTSRWALSPRSATASG